MSQNYYEIYRKRLNRYGLDFQSRIQGARERDFSSYLLQTIYRVEFEYEGKVYYGSLEHDKQDYSETQAYLLTERSLLLPNGTIIEAKNSEGATSIWMIWWLEHLEASGYNRYIVLKMTHHLQILTNKVIVNLWGYFSGPGKSKMTDTLKSSKDQSVYLENNNLYQFITPYDENLKHEGYFTVSYKNTTTAYVIKELDVNSTPGVAYVSVDPVPVRQTNIEQITDEAAAAEDFWLNGGNYGNT